MTTKATLYSHDITLVLFSWIIKQIIRKNIQSLETGASLRIIRHTRKVSSEYLLSIDIVAFYHVRGL